MITCGTQIVSGSTGGGGASAPAGTGVVTVSGGAFVTPVASAATTRATLGLGTAAVAALSDATPIVESGAGNAGTSGNVARADHVHPAAGGDGPDWQGAWDVGTAYAAGALVTSGGSTWRALQAVTGGSAPSEGATWTIAAQKGDTGATGASGTGLAAHTIDWTGTGATTTSGNGTASATSTVVSVSHTSVQTSGYSAGTYTAPRSLYVLQPSLGTSMITTQYTVTVRLASASGHTVGSYYFVCVEAGSTRYMIYANGNGTIGSFNSSPTGGGLLYTGTPAAGVGFNGTDWLRIRVDGARVLFYYGRGVGSAEPTETAWRSAGETAGVVAFDSAGYVTVTVGCLQSPAAGGSGSSGTFDSATLKGFR